MFEVKHIAKLLEIGSFPCFSGWVLGTLKYLAMVDSE